MPVSHERHFPNVVEREAMTDIEDRIAPVELRPGQVGRVAIASRKSIRSRAATNPRRPTVNGVAVGIVPTDLQTMGHFLFHRKLKPVINGVHAVFPDP